MSRFTEIVSTYGPQAMADLGISAAQAAGLFGNGDVESGGYTKLQELKPVVKGSRGGYGWMQWTGPRRRQYEAWCRDRAYPHDPASDEANYLFMVNELHSSEKVALAALKRAKTVDAAARAVCNKYLRPGIPHLDKRLASAQRAYAILAPGAAAAPTVRRIPAGKWAEEALPAFEIRAVQQRLLDLGYHIVGLPDGVWGVNTTAAVKKLQEQAAKTNPAITADGHYGPQTKALLADDTNRAVVSKTRQSVTAKDLAAVGNPVVVQGRQIQWANVWSAVSTAVGVLLLAVQNYQAGTEMPWWASAVAGFLPPWVGLILPFFVALYSAAASKGLIGNEVETVREGINNTGAPPVAAPSALPWPFNKFAGR